MSIKVLTYLLVLYFAGNTSILSFYFQQNGPVLITNESLTAELTLTAHGRIWEIHVSGQCITSVFGATSKTLRPMTP